MLERSKDGKKRKRVRVENQSTELVLGIGLLQRHVFPSLTEYQRNGRDVWVVLEKEMSLGIDKCIGSALNVTDWYVGVEFSIRGKWFCFLREGYRRLVIIMIPFLLILDNGI